MSHESEISTAEHYDAVVVGAGVTGIDQLARLVDLGLKVRLFEAGGGVGGTWYWNRYPLARFDSESYSYGYFRDRGLLEEWNWSEVFPAQPEIERYFNHVVDRWQLRDHIQLNTKVEGAVYDESTGQWDISLSTGEVVTCKYFIPAVGMLSAPYTPDFPNLDKFAGVMHHTSMWPEEPVDFRGKRVAVIGTGSTGVQIIPAVAEVAESLTVFQRTPNWVTPLNNKPLSHEEMAQIKASYDEIRAKIDVNPLGGPHEADMRNTLEVPEEERQAKFEQLWRDEGLAKVGNNFIDMPTNPKANELWCEFIAAKIRSRVKDPAVAEKLIPKDHGFGAKRPPMETNYYEVYNQDNVELVDLRETPIVTFTTTGIETTAQHFDFDVIVLATGFDAVTGAMERLNVRGEGGLDLREAWADGPQTLFGVGLPCFPNMFITGGPHVGIGNVPRGTEPQVDFITEVIKHAEEIGSKTVTTEAEAAAEWVAHALDLVADVAIMKYKHNWYTGGNIPGKKQLFTQYAGGIPEATRRMKECAASGFPGFEFR